MRNANKFVVESFQADILVDEASEGKDRVIDEGNNDPIVIIVQTPITKFKFINDKQGSAM